ncbi:uncharacterized protein V1518DRAFT_50140 [Limtongia smithiae]|uniref:uncharacterized protein n=1 Tax=Limtongia smithiae TaxID=1125753 RepID=UPI0034CDE939
METSVVNQRRSVAASHVDSESEYSHSRITSSDYETDATTMSEFTEPTIADQTQSSGATQHIESVDDSQFISAQVSVATTGLDVITIPIEHSTYSASENDVVEIACTEQNHSHVRAVDVATENIETRAPGSADLYYPVGVDNKPKVVQKAATIFGNRAAVKSVADVNTVYTSADNRMNWTTYAKSTNTGVTNSSEVSPTESANSCSTGLMDYDNIDRDDANHSSSIIVPKDCIRNRSWFSDNEKDEWEVGVTDDDPHSNSMAQICKYTSDADGLPDTESEIKSGAEEGVNEQIYAPVIVSSPTSEPDPVPSQTEQASLPLLMTAETRDIIKSKAYFMCHGHYVPVHEWMEYVPERALTEQGWTECYFGPWAPHDRDYSCINRHLRMLPPGLASVILLDLNNRYIFPYAHTPSDINTAKSATPQTRIGCQTCFYMTEYVYLVYTRYRQFLCADRWSLLDEEGPIRGRALRYEHCGHLARLATHSFEPSRQFPDS